MRVLVAGFQHETNTFAPTKAGWPAFVAGDAFPEFTRGAAMLERLAPTSLPMAGFVHDAAERGWTLVPSIWAGASPSAQIRREAFEHIATMLLEDARRKHYDAVYLDLHGAAVAEHVDDCEGELLARLRAVTGPALPIVCSLDLHANVGARLLRHAGALTVFRSYPHVDMAETGARAAGLLSELVGRGPFVTRSRRLPFLLPIHTQCTRVDPAAGVMADLATLEAQSGVHLGLAFGFPAADVPECGPVVFGHGRDAEAVEANVLALAENLIAEAASFAVELPDARRAVAQAFHAAATATRPVIVADTQDNPGAGADANTTGLLHALLDAGAGRRFPGAVALGLMHDPEAAAAAHAAGVGERLPLRLGRSVRCPDGRDSEPPVQALATVLALHAGDVALGGPMTAGNTVHLGPSACVEIDGVRVLVTSGKGQLIDEALCRFLGVEPRALKLLVVKSSVHFRAAFATIASRIIVARAPGPMPADPAELPWTRLPQDIARRP
ncbi:microcystin degradation protein MlrC [Rubrivivax gelatinosus]|nr:microcystin degradation protein MlrC [Rubrivivax gelatinosus]